VDGLSLALQAASSDTSTSTTAKLQASYAIVPDFFNGLLGGDGRSGNASSDLEGDVATHRRWCHHARFRVVRIYVRSIGAHNH
jgi:hypothetical protein